MYTVSEEPSCYMYVYVNTTEVALQQNFTKLLELQERVRNGTGDRRNTRTAKENYTTKQLQQPSLTHQNETFATFRLTETEPLPPELQPLAAPEGEVVNATDPIVQLFLKRQRRMKEVKKRREAGVLERLDRFAVKKYYTIRRG